ncbi:MAG TPA: YhgE/Pip domain-containing protein [Nakamurella multipartita]|nr:YhgE/Pip domain-containing protein [Nakamurella multipartita]
MIKTIKLAGFELRRFKGPLPIIALLFLLLVPSLYGALYLWSNWDPYGKLDQVPVAVVNQDVPVTGPDGQSVDAGNRLVAELQDDPIFDWQFVDAGTAADGLADGTYYLTITIPADFSANLVSGATDDPERAIVVMNRDDVNGYVIGLMTSTVQQRLEAAINRAAISSYFDAVFTNLDTLKQNVTDAANGAAQLASGADSALSGATDLAGGITQLKDGSTKLVGGLNDAKSGSSQLVTGLGTAKDGSAKLVTGLTQLQQGSSQLVPGAQQVADGNAKLASTVVPVLDQVNAALPAVQQANADAKARIDAFATGVTTQQAQIQAAVDALPASPEKAALQTAVTNAGTALNTAAGNAQQAAAGIDSTLGQLNQNAAADLTQASTDLTNLASGSAQVAAGAAQLNTGIGQALTGATDLDTGIGQLQAGASKLDSGIGDLQTGATQLDQGLGTAQTGSADLVTGLTQLDQGANQLASELTAGADKIPVFAQDQRDNAEQVLSSPADVQVNVANPANVYGRGLAPFFFAIAIWVFGISVFLVMRPISARALAGRASSPRIAIAGWLPVVGMAAVGSMLLLLVAQVGLGLDPVNVAGSIGVVLLAAACFTAIAHLLRTWLGVVGSAITLVLLMVQLTSAGGLYPVETLPAPLRAIHAFIPMTYLIDALRITFTGGPTDHLWRDVAVLAGFALVAVGACVWVVHRRRTFRPRDLHPLLG